MTVGGGGGGKRKIHLRLMEDILPLQGKRVSFFSIRKKKRGSLLSTPKAGETPGGGGSGVDQDEEFVDRGRVTVSWYEGTTSLELYEHVRRSVVRKLDLRGTVKLGDLRILDEAFDPPEGTVYLGKTNSSRFFVILFCFLTLRLIFYF